MDCLEVLREGPTGTKSPIERAAREIAAERVAFGTDSPNHNTDMELERTRVARIPETAKMTILDTNLLGIQAA